ncbi:diguanylate cyclase domain-containing protein [Acaryochloris marina]|uniref:diguanylate cyclase domain-containing protein n=1 Tax=Acaryochloris marina TaxID=155978 RepID=UPI0024B54BCF|nr:diguanylate cyclase [Acaryochloris marina]
MPEETEVKHVVARLQKILLEELEKHQWPVTFSMGVLIFEYPPSSVDELIQSADQLMYEAKDAGKNAVAYSNTNPGLFHSHRAVDMVGSQPQYPEPPECLKLLLSKPFAICLTIVALEGEDTLNRYV